jgi:hypothetical protein
VRHSEHFCATGRVDVRICDFDFSILPEFTLLLAMTDAMLFISQICVTLFMRAQIPSEKVSMSRIDDKENKNFLN